MLTLKQWFHLRGGPQQVHVHTDHNTLRYLKTCPRPLTPRQARWSPFLEKYNLTLWYVPGLENPAADACSRLTSRQLMDIENPTRTRMCHSEADAPWGRDLMLKKMQNRPTNSTLNQPSSRRTGSHCRRTRLWLRIHTSLRYISMMLQ